MSPQINIANSANKISPTTYSPLDGGDTPAGLKLNLPRVPGMIKKKAISDGNVIIVEDSEEPVPQKIETLDDP